MGTFKLNSKSSESFQILHLTDLHFNKSTQFSKPNRSPLLQALKSQVAEYHKKVGIDLIVVTGDISDNALSTNKETHISVLREAKAFLEELCRDCNITPSERLLVLPGNHDYKLFGSFLSPSSKQQFKEIFSLHFAHQVYEWGDRRVVIGCFDSNDEKGSYELALGYVDRGQFDAFKLLCNDELFRKGAEIRLAAVHHSPLPVPRAENFQLSTFEKLIGRKLVGASHCCPKHRVWDTAMTGFSS